MGPILEEVEVAEMDQEEVEIEWVAEVVVDMVVIEEEEGTDRILVIGTLLPMIGEGINKGTPHQEGMIEDTEVGAVMIAQPLYTETKGGKEKCRERPLESLKDMMCAADKDHRHRRLTTMIDG